MSCKAITPHLASLASRLQDRPFHLVYSDNQDKPPAEMLAYARASGFTDTLGHYSLTRFADHPRVKGTGYVPYYFVLDHRGTLRYEHMAGDSHGGDGLECVRWAERLVAEAPAVYCGPEEFVAHRALADRITSGTQLAAGLVEAEALLATAEGPAHSELERLLRGAVRYRDRRYRRAIALLATDPGAVLPRLRALAADLKGSLLVTPVRLEIDALTASADHRAAVEIGRHLAACRAWYEAEAARTQTPAARAALVRATAARLNRVIKDRDGLPVARHVASWLAEIAE